MNDETSELRRMTARLKKERRLLNDKIEQLGLENDELIRSCRRRIDESRELIRRAPTSRFAIDGTADDENRSKGN